MSNYFVCIHRPVLAQLGSLFLRLDNIKEFRLKPDCLLRLEFPRSYDSGLPSSFNLWHLSIRAESLTKGHAIGSHVSSSSQLTAQVAEDHHLLGKHMGSGTRDLGSNSSFYLLLPFLNDK